jgi:hypothetical protein
VCAYLAVSLGLAIPRLLIGERLYTNGLAAGSAFYGGMYPLDNYIDVILDGFMTTHCVFWTLFWIVCYSLLSVGLLMFTLNTSDRCLGRVFRVVRRPGPIRKEAPVSGRIVLKEPAA